MAGGKIGSLWKKMLGRGGDEAASSPPEGSAADMGPAGPELAGPFFIRYVPGGTARMLSRSPDFSAIRTLDGDVTITPQTYLEVPVAGDADALEIQVLLDDLRGSDPDILEVLETTSHCREWSGRTAEEIRSLLAAALDELVNRGLCRVVESVITSPAGDVLRPDAGETIEATQIFTAASRGDSRAVTAALDQGEDPNAFDDGSPLLHYSIMVDDPASLEQRLEVVRVLLDRGADIDAPDKDGWTAMLAACQTGNEGMIRLLLERGANPDAVDNKGWCAFHYLAVNDAEPALYEILAEAGTNPDAQSRLDGNTALMIAVNNATGAGVRALLSAGASAAVARNDGLTALHMAVSKGEIEIARMLLEADADVDRRGIGQGGTALHVAAGQGNLPMIDLLLTHGGDPAIGDDNGHSALDVANGTGNTEAAGRLTARREAPQEKPASGVIGSRPALGRWDAAPDGETDAELEARSPMIREQAPTVAKALDNLDGKLAEDPEDVEALKSRGILLQQIGLQKQALSSFDRIVAINGGDADVFSYCGQIILGSAVGSQSGDDRAGLLDLAKGSFNKALDKDANHVEAAIGMGTLFFVESNLEQAMPFFDRALKNDSSSGKAWHMKGLALQSAGQDVEAQTHFAKAAELGFKAS